MQQNHDMSVMNLVDTTTLPLTLSEKYRPGRIGQFIGLAAVKDILVRFAANPFASAWLFHGPGGVGKTTMAVALGHEIGAQVHHIAAKQCTLEVVENVCRDCHYAPCRMEDWSPGRFHLVLVDECDVMTDSAQYSFLSKLDFTAAPPETIFIFTTNNKDGLPKRFVSRCRTLEFSREGMATEIVRLLARIWAAELPSHEAQDFQQIARAADGDIRAAINSLEMLILSSQRQSGEVPHLPTSTIRTSSDRDMEDNLNEPFHSVSRVFPEMCPQSFAVLKSDIEEHGVRIPIVMHEGMILDGRSRWRAAQELRITCPTTEYAGSEPLLEIVSLNGIAAISAAAKGPWRRRRSRTLARVARGKLGQLTQFRKINLPDCSM